MSRITTLAAIAGLTLMGTQAPTTAATFDVNHLAPIAGLSGSLTDGGQVAQAATQKRSTPRKVRNTNPVRNPSQSNGRSYQPRLHPVIIHGKTQWWG